MKVWMWAGTAAFVAQIFGPPPANKTLTAVPGIKVGPFTLAERMATAVIRAATEATGLPNLPAVRDLR